MSEACIGNFAFSSFENDKYVKKDFFVDSIKCDGTSTAKRYRSYVVVWVSLNFSLNV